MTELPYISQNSFFSTFYSPDENMQRFGCFAIFFPVKSEYFLKSLLRQVNSYAFLNSSSHYDQKGTITKMNILSD